MTDKPELSASMQLRVDPEDGRQRAIFALAEAWASIDWKLAAFNREALGVVTDEHPTYTGHFEGYMAEAEKMLQRLESRGFTVVKKDPAPCAEPAPRPSSRSPWAYP